MAGWRTRHVAHSHYMHRFNQSIISIANIWLNEIYDYVFRLECSIFSVILELWIYC